MVLYIAQVLRIIFHLKWVYSEVALFYNKYFVLSYALDVVSTLS